LTGQKFAENLDFESVGWELHEKSQSRWSIEGSQMQLPLFRAFLAFAKIQLIKLYFSEELWRIYLASMSK
jgi:hypothetical protein